MNSNEHPDKHLLEQIERALESGRSPDSLLSDLNHTVPQAAPAFQQQLEDQLIARLHARQGESNMTTSAAPVRKPVVFPLTLVAALVVMLLVGSILISGSGKTPDPSLSVVLQAETATPALDPTPSPLLRIVVAYQNFPRGFHFPDTLEGVQEIAGYAAWPIDSVPFTALSEDGQGLEQLVGKIARTDIFREQPILSSLIVENPLDVASVGSDLALMLPQNIVAITIPFTSVQTTTGDLKAGDRVNVIAAMLFVDTGADFQTLGIVTTPFILTPQISGTPLAPQLMMQPIVQNALVIQIGAFPADDSGTPQPTSDTTNGDVITLAVSPDEATTLQWTVDAKIPLSLSLTIPAENALKPVVVAREFIPRGKQLTGDDLTTIYLDPALVPLDAIQVASQAAGQYANAPIEPWQPLTSSMLMGKPLFVERILPSNMVASEIRRDLITSMTPGLQPDDTIDITAHFLYPVWPADALVLGPNTLTSSDDQGLVVQDVILKGIRVYNMGQLTHPEGDDVAITVVLTVEDAALLKWVTESANPVALTLNREGELVDLHAQPQPDGRLSVQLPIQAVRGVTSVNGTPVAPTSNHFDIFISLGFTTQVGDTPARTEAQDVLQVIVPNAELLNPPEDIFVGNALMNATFLIAPADLPKLEWAVKSGMVLGVSWRP